jgi:hypothetical protein
LPLFFTPAETDQLLPEIERTVAHLSEIKKRSEALDDDVGMADAMDRLQHDIHKLEDLGCVLMDLNMGLVDFPAVRLGVRVWLCWKSGESKVGFWHGIQEGFANRKPVNEDEFYPDDIAIRALTGEISNLTRQHLQLFEEKTSRRSNIE